MKRQCNELWPPMSVANGRDRDVKATQCTYPERRSFPRRLGFNGYPCTTVRLPSIDWAPLSSRPNRINWWPLPHGPPPLYRTAPLCDRIVGLSFLSRPTLQPFSSGCPRRLVAAFLQPMAAISPPSIDAIPRVGSSSGGFLPCHQLNA